MLNLQNKIIVGQELQGKLDWIINSWIPAFDMVKAAVDARKGYGPSIFINTYAPCRFAIHQNLLNNDMNNDHNFLDFNCTIKREVWFKSSRFV